MLEKSVIKKIGLFAGGLLCGTAGVKVLSGRDAKKAYVHCTAATLRAKDSVMKTVTTIQENAEDVLAEAKAINQERADKDREEKINSEFSDEEYMVEVTDAETTAAEETKGE